MSSVVALKLYALLYSSYFYYFSFFFLSFISFWFCRSLLSFFIYSICAYVCIKDLTKVFAYSLPVAWGSVFTLFAQTVTQRGLRSHGVSITGSIRRHLSSSQLCAGHVFARRCLATGQRVAWQVRKQCHSPPGMTPGSHSTACPWNNFLDIYATILSQHPFVLSKNPPTCKVFGETMFSMTPRSFLKNCRCPVLNLLSIFIFREDTHNPRISHPLLPQCIYKFYLTVTLGVCSYIFWWCVLCSYTFCYLSRISCKVCMYISLVKRISNGFHYWY